MILPKKHTKRISALINTIRVWDAIAERDCSEQAFRTVNDAVRELRDYGIEAVSYINSLTSKPY